MFRTMWGSTKFQRVKSLWHTRVGHIRSIKTVDSQETSVQEATMTAELDQGYRDSMIIDKVEMQTPRTPTLDADFHRYTQERDHQATKLYTISVSPVSSSLTSASSSVSTLLSFVPAVSTPWRRCPSASDCSSSTTSSTFFPFASVSSSSALSPRKAAGNAINNVHTVCSRGRTTVSSSITRGSPYGELILVDILEARGLVLDRNESGVDVPFIVTMQLSRMRRKTKPAGHDSFTVNERFVFWLPSSSTNDQQTLNIFVRGGDERDLGEVHLSLAMPINEAFTDWYPLVCRTDGRKHGSIRVTMRRLVLTSSSMLEAAKNVSERESCLSFSNRRDDDELLPVLWSCFPRTESEVIPSREDDISNKFDIQRDVF
ncbi:hypothetical protein KXD40_000309 [Peronospora effusa]|uniref:C2 domain-containing protein n=1 Tax=Peronospora effusa TaxID=542832 RepID=A0A3M6VCQ3_9STRA|nr:hypothetical protein DD238_004343 [Peronospora effusa]UIZ21230.1 hypothetical protein KXD40_000309 [Peronospora effusa]